MSRQPSDSSNASPAKNRGPRRILGRLSLGGGSKMTLADVFAVDPSLRTILRRQSSGGSARTISSAAGISMRNDGRDNCLNGDAHAQHQRQALFGQREADGRGGAEGRDSATAAGASRSGVSEVHAAASEARDLAIERGEKLENMVDKSRELEDSAMAFGDMARQLRKQQEDETCSVS